MLFKSIPAASSCSLYLLISISRDATLVTSPFFILSALNTLNEKLIGLVWILLFLTNCSSIPMCVHLESTSALILRFLLFFVFIFAHTFSSFSVLLCQIRIIYLLWEFTGEISCTMPTQDLLQNPVSCLLYHPHSLILLEYFIYALTVSLYSPWLYILSCRTWNIFLFLFLSSLIGISLPYIYTCWNWSISASYSWSSHWIFQCPWAVLTLCMLFLYLSCNLVVLL